MDVIAIDQQGGKGNCCYAENVMPTLCSDSHGTPHALCYENQTDVVAFDGYNIDSSINTFKTITAGRNDTHNLPVACYCIQGNVVDRDIAQNGAGWREGKAHTLNSTDRHAVCYGISRTMLKGGAGATGGMPLEENLQPTITANGTGAVAYEKTEGEPQNMETYQKVSGSLCAAGYSKLGLQEAANDMYIVQSSWDGSQIAPTLTANNAGGGQRMPDKENFNAIIQQRKSRKYIIRRLTPLECCRLQGFPDWWTDGVEGSDSNIYKMWGNGIALPCAADVIGRIVKHVEKERSMSNG